MRRLCSRPACSLVATAVFGFDPDERIVWLAPPDAPTRVGDLCDRHARAMVPPHGWTLEDRRPTIPVPGHDPATPPATDAPAAKPSGKRRSKGSPGKERPAKERHDVPLPFDSAEGIATIDETDTERAAGGDAPAVDRAVPPERVASWTPRFDPADDLGGLLDAKTPLLSRAFRNDRGH